MNKTYLVVGIVMLSIFSGVGLSAVDDSITQQEPESHLEDGHDHGTHTHENSSEKANSSHHNSSDSEQPTA
jgi:hypothetical protein